MDKSTEQIIRQIAEIQLEAIEVAKKEHLTGIQLKRLCGESITNDVDRVISRLTDTYKQVIDYPRSISMLPVYQLNLCCSILTENYKTWELDNSEGVYGAFELFNSLIKSMKYEN